MPKIFSRERSSILKVEFIKYIEKKFTLIDLFKKISHLKNKYKYENSVSVTENIWVYTSLQGTVIYTYSAQILLTALNRVQRYQYIRYVD